MDKRYRANHASNLNKTQSKKKTKKEYNSNLQEEIHTCIFGDVSVKRVGSIILGE